MDHPPDVLRCLMHGLSEVDQHLVLDRIEQARDEQLNRKIHPPRRRRREASGELVPRQAPR
jgi:hypothetical protein